MRELQAASVAVRKKLQGGDAHLVELIQEKTAVEAQCRQALEQARNANERADAAEQQTAVSVRECEVRVRGEAKGVQTRLVREKLVLLKELHDLERHAAHGWISFQLMRREVAPSEAEVWEHAAPLPTDQ